MSGLNRLEMRNISIAFSGFAALSEVDFTFAGHSIHGQRRGQIDIDGGAFWRPCRL